jgi:peptidoglycan/xylan/chitin deacetylase (PgdA/CDA1 family)
VGNPESEPDLDPGLISAAPEEFRAQMEVVARRYRVVSLRDVLAAQRGSSKLPGNAVLITFDDAYTDFVDHAWPILRELNLPAVMFVPTAFPDADNSQGFWWDRLYAGLSRATNTVVHLPNIGDVDLVGSTSVKPALNACKRHVKSLHHDAAMDWVESALSMLPTIPSVSSVLGWNSLRELAKEGLEISPHGHSHALCTRLTKKELVHDLETSRTSIERELGGAAFSSVLAWPANACNQMVCRTAHEVGFEMGFGGARGVPRLPVSNPLDVMRVPVLRYQTELFRAQLRPGIARLGRKFVDERK